MKFPTTKHKLGAIQIIRNTQGGGWVGGWGGGGRTICHISIFCSFKL